MEELDRRHRSEKYQWLIMEKCADFTLRIWTDKPADDPMPAEVKERIYELTDQLIARVHWFVTHHFTDLQIRIFNLMMQGKTQKEIQKALKYTNQSTVAKMINGNATKNVKGIYHKHGGIIPKLRKLTKNDPQCLKILEELRELKA